MIAQDIALAVVHILAGWGILSVMHSRGCRGTERLFWIIAAFSAFTRPVSLFVPFWGRSLELTGVVAFTGVCWWAWSSTGVRTTTKTPADVEAVRGHLEGLLAEYKAKETADVLSMMGQNNAG